MPVTSHSFAGCTAEDNNDLSAYDIFMQAIILTCIQIFGKVHYLSVLLTLPASVLRTVYIIPSRLTDRHKNRNDCVRPEAERMEVILLDLFTVNYIVTSTVILISSHFIKFRKIP